MIISDLFGFLIKQIFSNLSFNRQSTDVGRVVNAPIFHVNADDPDAVVYVSKGITK